MELEFESAAARGLRRYVTLVSEALGLTGPGWTVQLETPLSAYVAVDLRHPDFPDWDTALLWHERRGWALAVEPRATGDLRVVAYLGGDPLPAPGEVASFAIRETGRTRAGSPAAFPDPPRPPGGDRADLIDRLAALAVPGSGPRQSSVPVSAR